LISDLRLRNHRSGKEVIAMVKGHYGRRLPAIIITGDTGPMELQELSKSGISLLHKPVTAEKLQQTITRVMAPNW